MGKIAQPDLLFSEHPNRRKIPLERVDNKRDRRYTPRDGNIDFSEPGIENGLYLVETVKGKKGLCAWQSAKLLLAPDRGDEVVARITEVFIGQGG